MNLTPIEYACLIQTARSIKHKNNDSHKEKWKSREQQKVMVSYTFLILVTSSCCGARPEDNFIRKQWS